MSVHDPVVNDPRDDSLIDVPVDCPFVDCPVVVHPVGVLLMEF